MVCANPAWQASKHSVSRNLLARRRRGALAEAVLEAAGHRLQIRHAAGADRLAALGLLGPVVAPDLRRRVAAACAPLLLEVERPLTATRAQAVGLLVALAHRRRAVTAARKPRHAMESGASLNLALPQGLVIAKDVAAEDKAQAVVEADPGLHLADLLRRVRLERNRLPLERPRKDLHRPGRSELLGR